MRRRVLLADDHTLVLEAFEKLLEPDYTVVGAVSDGRALLAAATQLKPDVIVLDIAMPFANRFFDFACSGLQVVEVRQFQHSDSSDCDPRPHPGCPVCTSNAAFGLYVFIIDANNQCLIILQNNQDIRM